MYTLDTYLRWQIQAQDSALHTSRHSEHAEVRARVPRIQRELACLRATLAGAETPYKAYCEAIVALNCEARANSQHGEFWRYRAADRLAARKTLIRSMKWKD